MSWVVAVARGVVAGLALGLVAAGLQLARRRTGRLDLVPPLAGAVVALAAARLGGDGQTDRVVDGLLLVPLAGLAGALISLILADRPRQGSPAVRAVLVPVAIFVLGRSVLEHWATDDASVAAARTSGLRLADRLIVSWADLVVAGLALGAVAGLGLGIGRGRTGLRVRAAEDSPDLLPLVGVEPGRLEAALAGVGAAAGALGGLLLGVTGVDPAPDATDLALRAGEAVLIGGGLRLVAALGGGVVVEVARVVGDEVADGWGPATGHALTVLVVGVRWVRAVRARVDDEPLVEELVA